MEPLPDRARARPGAAIADALAADEHRSIVADEGILRIVLVALGEIAPGDHFTLRLHEADPVVVAAPAVASA